MDVTLIKSLSCREITDADIPDGVKFCVVEITDLKAIAKELAKTIVSTSWVMSLDTRSRRAYEKTYADTAKALLEVFDRFEEDNKLGAEFGEVMVSITSLRGLNILLDHLVIPIAELWKPKKKQNEGFDFHTVCDNEIINFGEAKYSKKNTPYGEALRQIKGFIEEDKHLRDTPYLEKFISDEAMSNLDDDVFGIVAAFSLNGNENSNVRNALALSKKHISSLNIEYVYLVGVKC